MKSIIIGLASIIGITGCATPTPASFEQGADRKQFLRDDYECERDARQINGDACTQIEFYEKCMRSKGYEEIKGSARKGLCAQVF